MSQEGTFKTGPIDFTFPRGTVIVTFCTNEQRKCGKEFHGKDSDAGRDWGQEEKGMTEDEMAGWHH